MWLTIGTTSANIFAFATNLAVIRLFGPDVHGGIAWLLALAAVVTAFGDLGIGSTYGIKVVAESRRKGPSALTDTVSSVLVAAVAGGTAAAGALLLFALPVSRLAEGVTAGGVAIAAAWVWFSTVIRAATAVVVGLERTREQIFMLPAAEAGRLLSVGAIRALRLSAFGMLGAWAVAFALAAATSLRRVLRVAARDGFRLDLRRAQPLAVLGVLRQSLPFFVWYLGFFSLPYMMQLLLGAWAPRTEVSVFQVCFTWAALPRLLAIPLGRSTLARGATAVGTDDTGEIDEVLRSSLRLLALVSTLAFALACAIGAPVLDLLYGSLYGASLNVLLLLVVMTGAEALSMQLDHALMSRGRAATLAKIEVVRYALLVAASWVVIPTGHALGAAAVAAFVTVAATLVKLALSQVLFEGADGRPFARGSVVLAGTALAFFSLPYGGLAAVVAWGSLAGALRLAGPDDVSRGIALARQLGAVAVERGQARAREVFRGRSD